MGAGTLFYTDSCLNQNNPANPSEKKYVAVKRAFEGALELIADALDRIQSTRGYYYQVTPGTAPSLAIKSYVAQTDPAYVQYFKNDYTRSRMDKVLVMFQRAANIANVPGTGIRPPGRQGMVKIYCDNRDSSACSDPDTPIVTANNNDNDAE